MPLCVFAGTSILASFTYHNDGSGLIRSSVRGRYSTTFYVYDARGRLMSMTSSTGVVTTLHMTSNRTSHTVTMKTIATSAGDQDESRMGVGRRDVVIATQPGYLCDVIITTEGELLISYITRCLFLAVFLGQLVLGPASKFSIQLSKFCFTTTLQTKPIYCRKASFTGVRNCGIPVDIQIAVIWYLSLN